MRATSCFIFSASSARFFPAASSFCARFSICSSHVLFLRFFPFIQSDNCTAFQRIFCRSDSLATAASCAADTARPCSAASSLLVRVSKGATTAASTAAATRAAKEQQQEHHPHLLCASRGVTRMPWPAGTQVGARITEANRLESPSPVMAGSGCEAFFPAEPSRIAAADLELPTADSARRPLTATA